MSFIAGMVLGEMMASDNNPLAEIQSSNVKFIPLTDSTDGSRLLLNVSRIVRMKEQWTTDKRTGRKDRWAMVQYLVATGTDVLYVKETLDEIVRLLS